MPIQLVSRFFLLFISRKTAVLYTVMLFTVVLGGLFYWQYISLQTHILDTARIQAQGLFNKDLIFRRWVGMHGGVYVPPTEDTPPNPHLAFLKNRDIVSTTGQNLTLINPAYMTRQVHELEQKYHGYRGHITSLDPIRPENAATPWEKKALEKFAGGADEVKELVWLDGQEFLCWMGPLYTEESCLRCHGSQGAKVGEIRGGISVAVPMAPLRESMEPHAHAVLLGFAGIWLFGLTCIFFANRGLQAYLDARASAEEKYRAITNDLPLLLCRNLMDGEILFVNTAYGNYFGVEPEQMIGKNFWGFIPEPDRTMVRHNLAQLRPDNPACTHEHKVIRRDGTERIMRWTNRLVVEAGENIVQGYGEDITEQQLMKDRLLQGEKMTTIAGLAAGVAHEINTPLSGILQAAQMIELGLDPKRKDNQAAAKSCTVDLVQIQAYLKEKKLDFFLGGIKKSAENAARIIADLLQFSRPGEESQIKIDPAELVDRAIELARSDYTLKKEYNVMGVTFKREYDPKLDSLICMPMEIEQVLINLIKNSCQAFVEKSRRENPHIILRLFRKGSMAVLEIEDNGPGMPPEVQQQVFDPFFTTKDIGKGTGLGLYVAYAIICGKHQGTMTVSSASGTGTKFIIELPVGGVQKDGQNG